MREDQNHWLPAYLKLSPVAVSSQLTALRLAMESCVLCPRQCRVNRLKGEKGFCAAPSEAVVSSFGPHYGEERELVGESGSGTIFFSHCNLECLFCQNWTISRAVEGGVTEDSSALADRMLYLQKLGCSNINLVTPTPYIYQVARAIDLAAGRGLKLPVVYNCGGYESVEMIALLEGFIDIYMPDAKYGSDAAGAKYSGVSDYYSRLKNALAEMQRQVGDLQVDSKGLARRGLLVRHLVLPGDICNSEEISRFLYEEISPHCAVNVMAQYHPAYRADAYPELNRRISTAEYLAARSKFSVKKLRLL